MNVDFFEIEVVENIPFTKVNRNLMKTISLIESVNEILVQVSRGNRVKKKEMIKIKDFLRDNMLNNGKGGYKTQWIKKTIIIPTGMKYR